jgi:hypothetical protein
MTRIWLVVNPASGSYDPALVDMLNAVAQANGAHIDRTIAFPEEDLPTATTLSGGNVDLLAIHTGDGTINALHDSIAGWDGGLLVLPGGTMNLLAKVLHGPAAPADILTAALSGQAVHRRMTTVEPIDSNVDFCALVGVFTGPTTAWGAVRETLRHRDLGGIMEAVPRALGETFSGDQVGINGDERRYPSIYLEPSHGRLRVLGFTAAGAGDLLSHGSAWLGGDFRNGPHDPLGMADEVCIVSAAKSIGLLVDGERGHADIPLRLRAGTSRVDFIATRRDSVAAAEG